ncbi:MULTISPECIES: aspartate kinase [Prochlorococcus]|uniref:aspartate kinase n=1 Tax=Prochlorococcus TaxID=1218 RepID=UPI0005338E5C|nr:MULTISPECIES: aspartate kinase [Prochlorococcus]KGG13676.1 Aspartokinase [Prochlorococcus sp. MIT 0601]
MSLLVQKFGGTSVGSIERIQSVAKRIACSHEAGHQLVIVVSAMGNTTNDLNNLAQSISNNPPPRELDMLLSTGEQISIALLSIALNELGVRAKSMTGSQIGIVTESSHGKARILEIKTERIESLLEEEQVVIIAGFQGTSLGSGGTMEITTLGRGGSDTSAVALAAALKAEACEIYTDVPGVLTTDPRKVREAKLIQEITCDEMLELASLGAAVLHPRAVEIARNYGVKLIVRSSWDNDTGTTLTSQANREIGKEGLELGRPVNGAELLENQAVLGLSHIPDQPGIAADLFETLSKGGVNVDLIIQSTHEGKSNDIAFTIAQNDLGKAKSLCEKLIKTLGGKLSTQSEMSKLSIRGAGIMGRPGIAAKLFETISKAGINLRLIATSEVKVSCVIDSKMGSKALRAVCEAFEINQQQTQINPKPIPTSEPAVRGVALDNNQVQVSVVNIPDKPGTAATICRTLSENGITLDTIVQSERTQKNGGRTISFTMNKDDRKKIDNAIYPLLKSWQGSALEDGMAIARISSVGAGMPETIGTAARMFRALAANQINIEMIATSEIRTTCIVSEKDGTKALEAVHQFFNLHQDK